MKVRFLLISLAAVALSCSCEKRNSCDFDGLYQFELRAELSPRQDTFRVGDTITLISSFEDKIFERNTGSLYHLRDFRFYPRTGLIHLDTVPAFISIENVLFIFDLEEDYNVKYESHNRGTSRVSLEYIYRNNEYFMSYKIVLLKTGLYSFYINSGLYPINENQDFPGKCSGKGSEAPIQLNAGVDNNVGLISNAADTAFANKVIEDTQDFFHDAAGYIFFVVE